MRARPSLLWTLAALAALTAAPAFGQSQPAMSAAPAAREQTADQQIHHVLNRLAFGARPGDVDKIRQMGVDAWIEQQLHPEKIADPAVTQLLSQLPTYSASVEQLRKEFLPPQQIKQQENRAKTKADSQALRQEQAAGRQIMAELQAERIGRAVVSEHQLEEVMVDFWLNHFSVYAGKAQQQMRYYLTSYERDVIRPNVFGKFRDLLGAVAHSPAMLLYLDNALSIADTNRSTTVAAGRGGRGRGSAADRLAARGGRGPVGPIGSGPPPQLQQVKGKANGLNENYGRELLELHTLGVDGGYSQKDVTEVARALTGWTIAPQQLQEAMAGGAGAGGRGRGGRGRGALDQAGPGALMKGDFLFRPAVHDAEAKTILGVNFKAGRGIEDGEQVLDMVARHPSTAKFIATKLARRFVSDSPPPALIARAAETFRKTDGDIREVVRTIITSPEFFAAAAYRSKVKTPFEVVVSTMRVVGAPADPTPRTAQVLSQLGQPIFGRQTPDGWPDVGSAWVNTGSILNRINYGTTVAAGRVPGSVPTAWPLPVGLSRETRAAQVDAVVLAFLGGDASADTRSVLMTGTNPLLATVKPDSNVMGVPPDSVAQAITGMSRAELARAQGGRAFQQVNLTGIPQIVGLALGSPEFQRR